MAEVVVALVVQRIDDLLIEEANALHGVRDQIQEILAEFREIQRHLNYADARREEKIRVWVAEVRKLAYDTEDVLESFVLESSYMKKGGIKNIFKRHVKVNHKFRSDIKHIKNKISELKAGLGEYDMRFTSEGVFSRYANERRSKVTRFYSHRNVADVEVVGFKEDLDYLVKILKGSSETCYRVVSICGMGGLGKTTLAKKIYDTPAIKRHFECLAWVSISQNLHKINVLQRILFQLVPDQEKREEILKLSEDALVEKILAVQQSKNCLIVLDDIWKKEDWDNLKAAFSSGHAKNKLLLTSRNLEVAKHVDPESFLYQPRILSEDESWELLAMKALPMKDLTDYRVVKQMEELGRKMVKHCKGLPLAIVFLGGILVTKPSLIEWERVFHDVERSLREGRGLGQVFEILVLSYTELPYQLKPCFIYLGTFLEDSVIKAEKLYQMWMAEGLLLKKDRREGETMMDVAEFYLAELAHRCMVEVEIEEDESSIRKLKSCRTHDLMRDLSISKAEEEGFFKPVDYQLVESSSSSSTNYTRRLVINHIGEDITSKDIPLDNEAMRHLRSLIFNVYLGRLPQIPRLDFTKFKLLRVLSIESFFVEEVKGARAIGYLKHLRYLSLKGSYFIMFMSLKNMEYLQTLDLRIDVNSTKKSMLKGMGRKSMLKGMGRLLHLYLPVNEEFLEKKKLRLDDLRNLETLENFDSRWCETKDIFNLINLRELTSLVNCIEDLSEIINYHSSISSRNLRYSSLTIDGCNLSSDKGSFLLRQLLLTGDSRVNKLVLYRCKVKLRADDHVNFSSNLTILEIWVPEFEELEDTMAIVGKMPNLRRFTLFGNSQMTELVCSATSFPRLRFLHLWYLENLKSWRVDEGAMPCLSELKIQRCDRLKMLPDGIKFLTALRDLEIKDMPEAFNDRIRVVNGEEGEDFHEVRHVPSITFQSSFE